MNELMKKAIARFDKAAQEYAFKGTHTGSTRYDEVCAEYYSAKQDLIDQIEEAVKSAYSTGEVAGQSRARSYPGFGDMGG